MNIVVRPPKIPDGTASRASVCRGLSERERDSRERDHLNEEEEEEGDPRMASQYPKGWSELMRGARFKEVLTEVL
jgi:hypothetical protein